MHFEDKIPLSLLADISSLFTLTRTRSIQASAYGRGSLSLKR